MKVTPSALAEVLVIEPRVFRDHRGFLLEAFNAARFARHGLALEFVQTNHSRSGRGVLRGLHFQADRPQGKLVFAARGAVFDVAVDVRRGSPTFGQWAGTRLDDESHHALWIPPGFAHGFCVLGDGADLVYECTAPYDPDDERSVAFDDPDIGIEWPGSDWVLSEKDRASPRLAEVASLPAYRP